KITDPSCALIPALMKIATPVICRTVRSKEREFILAATDAIRPRKHLKQAKCTAYQQGARRRLQGWQAGRAGNRGASPEFQEQIHGCGVAGPEFWQLTDSV